MQREVDGSRECKSRDQIETVNVMRTTHSTVAVSHHSTGNSAQSISQFNHSRVKSRPSSGFGLDLGAPAERYFQQRANARNAVEVFTWTQENERRIAQFE